MFPYTRHKTLDKLYIIYETFDSMRDHTLRETKQHAQITSLYTHAIGATTATSSYAPTANQYRLRHCYCCWALRRISIYV